MAYLLIISVKRVKINGELGLAAFEDDVVSILSHEIAGTELDELDILLSHKTLGMYQLNVDRKFIPEKEKISVLLNGKIYQEIFLYPANDDKTFINKITSFPFINTVIHVAQGNYYTKLKDLKMWIRKVLGTNRKSQVQVIPIARGAWSHDENPIIKLQKDGVQKLTDIDLLTILLWNLRQKDSAPCMRVSRTLLEQFNGLKRSDKTTDNQILEIDGFLEVDLPYLRAGLEIGIRSNSQNLKPGLELKTQRAVYEHFAPTIRHENREVLIELLLDAKYRLIKDVIISIGILTENPVHPREVFHPAIINSAAGIILIHNHPSGDPTPSQEDITTTHLLVTVGEYHQIPILDHIVFGADDFTSLKKEKLLMPEDIKSTITRERFADSEWGL